MSVIVHYFDWYKESSWRGATLPLLKWHLILSFCLMILLLALVVAGGFLLLLLIIVLGFCIKTVCDKTDVIPTLIFIISILKCKFTRLKSCLFISFKNLFKILNFFSLNHYIYILICRCYESSCTKYSLKILKYGLKTLCSRGFKHNST
jgi:hypothetical protein